MAGTYSQVSRRGSIPWAPFVSFLCTLVNIYFGKHQSCISVTLWKETSLPSFPILRDWGRHYPICGESFWHGGYSGFKLKASPTYNENCSESWGSCPEHIKSYSLPYPWVHADTFHHSYPTDSWILFLPLAHRVCWRHQGIRVGPEAVDQAYCRHVPPRLWHPPQDPKLVLCERSSSEGRYDLLLENISWQVRYITYWPFFCSPIWWN